VGVICLKPFSISKIYKDDKGNKVVDINPLPENCCNFDCVFCPLSRTAVKTEYCQYFEGTEQFIDRLEKLLNDHNLDQVFINPDGEALLNAELSKVIDQLKKHKVRIKLLSNGYLFNHSEYFTILNRCDEIIGELAVVDEADFIKLHRPLANYSLKKHIGSMASFNRKYQGRLVLAINILKNYSDSTEAVQDFAKLIKRIKPDRIVLETPQKEKFKKGFAVDTDKLEKIRKKLRAIIGSEYLGENEI
jgi:wyosine [tRNA(Phe)-imidazoG37] synthetase (radical SAM superfamily)